MFVEDWDRVGRLSHAVASSAARFEHGHVQLAALNVRGTATAGRPTGLLQPERNPLFDDKDGVPKRKPDGTVDEAGPATAKPTVTASTLHELVGVFSGVRDSVFLLLGLSLLHVGVNVRTELADDRIGKCALFSTATLVCTAVLWVAAFAMSVARYNRLTNTLSETTLDLALVCLGCVLQIITKPSAFVASANTATSQLYCSISETHGGSMALVGWLCGEAISFLSAGRTLAYYALQPPCGPGWVWVVMLVGVGVTLYPLTDFVISPALRDAIETVNFTSTLANGL